MQANYGFTGRTILVAGAAGGIGSEIAARLGREGANLVLADIAPIEPPPEGEAITIELDALDPIAWRDARVAAEERFGGLHGFVHTIGVLGRESPVTELAIEEWKLIVDTNLTSAFLALNALLPSFVEQGEGRVVLMASIAGKEGNARQAAYSAAKGGLIALTKAAAKEVATDGVRINSVAPTMIEGPFMDGMTQGQIDGLLTKVPMRRAGRPAEVAALVSWLLSDESTFSTGQCFDLSGGRAVY